MARLVHAELAAARQPHHGQQTPASVVDGRARDPARHHLAHEGPDVVAQEIELVGAVHVRPVDRDLGRRQPEDEPAVPDVDVGQTEDLAQELAVRVGFLAVDDDVRAADHEAHSRTAHGRARRGIECSQSASSARKAAMNASGWSSIRWWWASGISMSGALRLRSSYMYSPVSG